jgi:cytochrome oxidase Cu insertion factor (SCO1/SenC/PrrC family)/thiol-disulfide isomerase/thioredoxin
MVTRLFATLMVVSAVVLVCVMTAGVARADGDPGSDVLLDQNLYSTVLNTGQQTQLGRVLAATQKAGAPIRVAIIANPANLGTVSELWRKPQTYANYLGYELSLAYPGRVLVVMPNGYGLSWRANRSAEQRLADLVARYRPTSTSGSGYVKATIATVDLLEQQAGIKLSTLKRDESSVADRGTDTKVLGWKQPAAATTLRLTVARPKHHSNTGLIIALLVVLVVLGAAFLVLLRRVGIKVRGVNVWATGVLAAVVIAALVVSQGKSSPARAPSGGTLASNPNLDPGSKLPGRLAPNFSLTDQSGRRISLSQYRGKVVVLSFVDAECQTICPLTTQAMLDAKAALGKAGKDVELLGVNANWKSLQVDDVLNYTELHGLSGRWQFLTGSLKQLEQVWSAYHVNEKALDHANSNDIEHIAATYVIGPDGRERDLFTTYPSYAAIGQLGERIAQDASRWLPKHPPVHMDESYAAIHGIQPGRDVTLPRLGGGTVELGSGHPRLYLFFATWDRQTTPISAELSELDGYNAEARTRRLPGLTAIDEGSVEPSPGALSAFISGLPRKPNYPVAVDESGRIADGYHVQGEPWFVLVNRAGKIVWYQEVYTSGWPSLTSLDQQVQNALKSDGQAAPARGIVKQQLAGSPARLAALHAQSSQLLGGGQTALDERIERLRGYPIVLNLWASWCEPCQKEFGLFEQASAQYGKRIAFLGADVDDNAPDARSFLRSHHVSYPSYAVTDSSIDKLLSGGLEGTPTTIFISQTGRIESIHPGQYLTQGTLDQAIQNAALGG